MKLHKYLTRAGDFTEVTALLFLLHAFACISGFLILGASPYINLISLACMVALDIAFFLALKRSDSRNAAHLLVLGWYVLLFFNVRLGALLFFPPEALEFPGGFEGSYLTGEEISGGLVFLASGLIAILGGIFLAGMRPMPMRPVGVPVKNFSIWGVTVYWAVTYAAAYYVAVYLGVTIFGAPGNWGNRMAWVRIIFDTDVALMFTIVWAVIQWQYFGLTKLQKLHVGLLVLGWLIFSLIIGSRGGPFRILIFVFLATLAIKPKFKLSVTGFAALIGTLFLVNSYLFSIGTAFRHAQLENVDVTQSVANYEARSVEFEPYFFTAEQQDISPLRRKFYESHIVRSVALKLRPTVTRLAIVDYPLIVLIEPGNQEVIDYYIRSLHPVKNFLNNMVPGEIFKESMVNTSRIFPMAYGGKSLQDISEGYMSEPFTLWGEVWLLAGYFGLLLLGMVAFAVQRGLTFIDQRPAAHWVVVRFVYIMTVLSGVYGMFGIDYWLTSVAHFSLSSLIAWFFISRFKK